MQVTKLTPKRYPSLRQQFLLPAGLLLFASLLMILPLEGFVSSVKAVLAYVFIPQVRAAHSTAKYMQNVSQTVQELLNTHQENQQLKQEIETAQLLAAQSQTILAENKRLSEILEIKATLPWKGVWARVAYREPSRWNSVTLDKGTQDGIRERSAVLAVENGKAGLVGVVVEVTENTSKVLLVRDEDFAAAVSLERGSEDGLLSGNGPRAVQIKYLPLLSQVAKGDKVYTSASSSVFPAGILVGAVSSVHENTGFQTALSVEVTPQVRLSAVKEVFVLLEGK